MARVLQRCVILASFVFRECTHQRVQRAPVLLEVFGALRGRAGEIDRYEERFATSSRGSSEPFPGRACSLRRVALGQQLSLVGGRQRLGGGRQQLRLGGGRQQLRLGGGRCREGCAECGQVQGGFLGSRARRGRALREK